jgi:hypothetical protein
MLTNAAEWNGMGRHHGPALNAGMPAKIDLPDTGRHWPSWRGKNQLF